MKIGLLGFGTVGRGFYELARETKEVSVAAVLSRRPRPELTDCLVTADYDAIVKDESIDVIVEVIGGLHPAYEYVSAALAAGKHVVTANKQMVCAYYNELLALTEKSGACLRCTAAAGGGIPWLSSLGRAAEMDRITKVEGILNGTTNFILSAMTDSGADYAEMLAEAQRLGYAEADPTADVEGYDARRKLVLSANIAFGVSVQEEEIPCFGISTVTAADIRGFAQAGLCCKLIAHAEERGGKVAACVEPMLFAQNEPEAHTGGSGNLVSLYAERIGKQSFSGAGAGDYPTGSNVLADCLTIAEGCGSFYTRKNEPRRVDNSAVSQRYYLRTSAVIDVAVERGMGPGCITAPMTVAEAHALAASLRESGAEVFLAALREDA